MITSDDIFKVLLQARTEREQTLMKSRMLTDASNAINTKTWADLDFTRHIDCETGENYNKYKEALDMRGKSMSRYLRDKLGKEERGMSNGENSFVYMSELMQKEGLYLLDEPENSLSPNMQLQLAQLLLYSTWRATTTARSSWPRTPPSCSQSPTQKSTTSMPPPPPCAPLNSSPPCAPTTTSFPQ